MTDRSASVIALLKNVASERKIEYQTCLQYFCQEEFLRRLSKSKYAENFVLKGGFFLYCLTNFNSRITYDMDFLLSQIPNSPESLGHIIDEIIQTPTENDFVRFKLIKIVKINLKNEYTGLSATLLGIIKNTKTPFSIDFGVGDIIYPTKERREIPTQLKNFEKPTVNTYSIESVIAEKTDSILNLFETSSRMKDFYDIYFLSKHFDIDGNDLAGAFKRTFETRHRFFTESKVKRLPDIYKFDPTNALWVSFAKKIKKENLIFKDVLSNIYLFLYEPLICTLLNKPFNKHWNSSLYKWN